MPTTCLNYDKKCGGCPLLALPYREQLNQKQARLQGLLGGFAPVRAVQGRAEPYHYRNKAIASFAMQHGRLVCGLYAEGTHRVLPSADCLLQEEILNKTLAAVLEAARAEKKIGKALEAHVALHAGDDAASAALVQVMGLNLAELFIVSDCQVSSAEPDAASTVGQGANFPGLTVEVSEARGDKCERCWMHSPTVGADADHPTLCARCAAVVRKLPQF